MDRRVGKGIECVADGMEVERARSETEETVEEIKRKNKRKVNYHHHSTEIASIEHILI